MDFLSDLKQEAERVLVDPNKQQNQNNEFLKKFVKLPKEGALTVRLLPPSHGMKYPWLETRLHRINNRSFHCPYEKGENGRWFGQMGVCPVCDHYRWLWKQSELPGVSQSDAANYQALARKIKAVPRYYFNCIVRDDPSQEGVKILSVGQIVYKMFIRALVGDPTLNYRKKLGNIFDTTGVEGRDFTFVVKQLKSGNQSFPNYNESVFEDPSPAGTPDQVQKWLSECHNLMELRQLKPAADLKLNLQIELGVVKPDANSGYDPSDFLVKDENSESAPSAPVAQSSHEAADVSHEMIDDSMLPDDLLDEIRGM